MIIQNIIFHKIISQQHSSVVNIVPRSGEILLPDSNADILLEQVSVNYQKENFLAYAGFADSEWFPNELSRLVNRMTDFYDFSIDSLKKLQQQMIRVPAATGGYLTFIRYTHNGAPYFMVILLKDRADIAVTADLELEEVLSLELEKLHFAARIDITKWQAQNQRERQSYISFLKGRGGNVVVVNYFKAFLGINEDQFSDPLQHTKDIVDAISNFALEFIPETARDTIVQNIYEYAKQKIEEEDVISNAAIANLISPDAPTQFTEYLIDNNYEIPGEFQPVESSLRNLNRFRVKSKHFYLSFNILATESNEIWQNDRGHLVIDGSHIPDTVMSRVPQR